MNSSKILLNVSIEGFRYVFSDEDDQKLNYVPGMNPPQLIQGIENLLEMEGKVRDMHLFIGESTATGGEIGSPQRSAYALALRQELDKLVQENKNGGQPIQIYKEADHIYSSLDEFREAFHRRKEELMNHNSKRNFFSSYRIVVSDPSLSSSSVVIYPLNRIIMTNFERVHTELLNPNQ
jgi:hypothetical protein